MNFLSTNWFKLWLATFMIAGMLIVKIYGLTQKADVPNPIDYPQNWTLPLNQYAAEHHLFRKVWIASTTFSLDLHFFIFLFNWVRDGYSVRTPLTMFFFYSIRAILQQVFILPFPKYIYWEDPGFPCLMNIYGKQSDFFYSGHIGFSLMLILENHSMKYTKCVYFGIFSTIYVGFTLLVFRVHYTIDLFAGLVMAHYWFMLTGKISDWVDGKLLNKKIRSLNPDEQIRMLNDSSGGNFNK